jgi:drug/metabolite transporter (DMT)-like permease
MTSESAGERRGDNPLHAIVLMVAAGVIFAATDAIVKFLTDELPPAQIVWSRYFFYLPILVPWALLRRRDLAVASPWPQMARGTLLFVSTVLATIAIADLPLVEMTTIGFTGPLMTTALSVFMLSEKVGIRRWAAVTVGFIGVLIVMRPGGAAFSWPALLTLSGTLAWSFGFVLTRRLGAHDSALATLCWTTAIGLVGGTILAVPAWVEPSVAAWGWMAINGAGNLFAQWLVIRSLEKAAASIVAPLIYVQLAWATILGWLVFGQTPDAGTWLGAAVIIASGIYIWHRERVRASQRSRG